MKTNAIISALCVVGIIGAFANDGALIQRGRTDGPPEEPVVPGAIPIQKVVYWSDIPGMKWNWTTQVTNKPSIPTVGTLNTTATSAQSTSASESLSGNITLHKIAKTGAYGDLSGTPTIPTVGTLNTTLTTSQATSANESLSGTIKLHKVAKTGTFSDMIGNNLLLGFEDKYVKIDNLGNIKYFNVFEGNDEYTLNLPRKNGYLAVLSDIPSTNGLASKSWVNTHQWAWSSISNKPSFATVATSGSYNDLSDKPSIPAAQVNADWNASSGVAQILNKPTLATVATSGDYDDLLNKPTIPEKTVWYGISSDSVAVTARSVTTTTGDFRLENGSRIYVYFERAFQGYSLTLNVDNTGAKSVSPVRNDSLPQYYFVNGQVVEFIYDETSQRYVVVDGAVATTTYYGRTVLENSTNSTSNAKAATPNSVRQVALAIGVERTARLNAGYATQSWVNDHKWDWVTQVTNSPFTLHTTGFPYVEVPIGFAATDSGVGYAIPSSASFAGAKVHGIESLGAGDGIITNCYGGIGLGMAFNVTNDVAFVWSGRDYNGAKYGSHGMSTFNVDPHDGPAGFWIGETNLATYLANASGGVSSLAIGRNGTPYTGDVELVLTHADPVVTLTTNYPTGIKIGSLSYTAGFAQLDIFEKGAPGFSPDWMNQPVTTDMYIPTNVSVFNNDAGYVTANHTHSNLVNGSTKVIANENGTMTISKGDGSSVYYSVTGTYDQYNPRAIAQTDLSSYSEFSPSVSYTGYSDPILYNGAVYACQTTHTGPWDESHFRLLVPADKAGFHVRITTATSLGSLEPNQTTTAHIDVVWFLPLVGGSTQWQEHTLISYDATVQYYGTAEGKKTFGVYNQSNVVYGDDYNGSSSGLGGVTMLASSYYYIRDYSPGGISRIDFVGGPIAWGDTRFGWSDYLVANESFTKTVATVDQISSLDNKMDKVFNPTAGHIVTVTATGSLTDFGESPWGIRGDWNETNTNSVNYILNKPTNVSAFNNDAGYVKTNAVGSLVLGPSSANQASRAYTIVAGTGGANNESDNSIIIGPGSHIYQNSDYSGIFGPGGSIKAGSPYSFVFGASTVEAGCPNSFVIGSSATSTNASSFLWTADSTGNKTLPAAKITHGDGTFNINTLDGVAGVYIGDTNLQQIIRLEAKAMIHDAVSQVNTNLQSAEDTRVALTNLITILKNL